MIAHVYRMNANNVTVHSSFVIGEIAWKIWSKLLHGLKHSHYDLYNSD